MSTRNTLAALAALVLLVGGFALFANSDDDGSATTDFVTGGPITGPNGEDLGIWADAIAGLSPEAAADRAFEFERSIASSLTEINHCLVDLMDSEPLDEPIGGGDVEGAIPRLIPGDRAFAESEGFGYAALHENASAYPREVTGCYSARTIDGLLGLDDTREEVARSALDRFLSLVLRPDPELAVAGQIEVLVGSDSAIEDNTPTWTACMADKGREFDSELRARAHFAQQYFDVNDADFTALKADEVSVATAAWECSGGDAGALLRENIRQRVLAEFVVANRAELDVELDIALEGACDGASRLMNDGSVNYREEGEARLQSLGCSGSAPHDGAG